MSNLSSLKECKDCKKNLPLSSFSKDCGMKDGLCCRCKSCKKARYGSKLVEWRRDIRDEAIRAKDGISKRYIQDRISNYKSRAKSKGYAFDLDTDYLLELWKKQEGKCAYTARPMRIVNLKYDFWSPSLDRLDPLKGYTKGNVAWTLHGVNCFKQELTLEEFLQFVNSIVWPKDPNEIR